MSCSWKYAVKLNGVKVQYVRRGGTYGKYMPAPLWTAKDADVCRFSAWESLLIVILSGVSPKSAAWDGAWKMRREESTQLAACTRFALLCLWYSRKCTGAKDFPVFPVLQQGSRTKQTDFWLMQILQFLLHEAHSLPWVLAGFHNFFFRFSVWLFLFYMCKQYVQVFCPNQIGARWQNDCICPVWFLTWSSSKSRFWLHWLFCLTSLAMKMRALAHPVVGCLYLPHLSLLRVPGLPAGSIWRGQLFAKLCLGYLIRCRVCMGWDYAFSCQKRAFA